MMTKSLSIVLSIALLATVSLAQNCNNPLLDIYNLTGLSAPQSGSGLPFCQNLQNGQTCCSAATVGTFQGLINDLANQLQSAASTRDLYLADIRNNYLAQYQSLAGVLQSYAGDIPAISAQNSALGNNLTTDSTTLTDVSNRLTGINNDFNNALRDYQSTRVECFEDLLQVQASAWCLACDPNYANNGVRADGTITFSNDLREEVSGNCYDFLEAAERFNPLIRARQSLERLQNLTEYMAAFRSSGAIPDTVLPRTFINSSTSPAQRTVGIPTGCVDDDNCVWQANNLFPRGILNQTIAANGAGVVGGADLTFDQLGVINNTAVAPANSTEEAIVAPANGTAAAVAPSDADNNTNATAGQNATATNDTAAAAAPSGADNDNNTNTTAGQNATTANDTTAVAPSGADNDTNTTAGQNTTAADNTDNNNSSRLLQNAAQSAWSPDLDNTGLVYTIVADPAGVLAANPATTAANNNISDDSDSGCTLTVGVAMMASLTMVALF